MGASGWTWAAAAYSSDVAGGTPNANDEYVAQLTVAAAGSYDYAYRFRLGAGAYFYADLDGTTAAYSPMAAGA